MKFITEPKSREMKKVKYFNLELIVPVETKYITVEESGEVVLWAERSEPFIRDYTWGESNWIGNAIQFEMGYVDLEGLDWRKTLVTY